MKKIFVFVGSVFILLGCNVDKGKKVDPAQLTFDTSDRAEMFFKNVRQSYYLVDENREAGIYLYTLKNWHEVASPELVPVIAFNWRQDKAYIMLQWSPHLAAKSQIGIWAGSDSVNEMRNYFHGNMAEQRDLAVWLYNSLPDHSEFLVSGDTVNYPLFRSADEREAFRITLYDYLRLTGFF